jgi:hypothetical protein
MQDIVKGKAMNDISRVCITVSVKVLEKFPMILPYPYYY